MAALIPAPLYQQICRVMPIPCVDVVVQDSRGRLLLLQRGNQPARGQWWFPGGRVHYGELRCQAARRKVIEECGLQPERLDEIGTCDVMFPPGPGAAVTHHAITTLFDAYVSGEDVVLDDQSIASSWRTPAEWLERVLHPFVKQTIERKA